MKNTLKRVYAVLRAVVVTAIVAAVVLYALAFVLLSLPAVQERLRGVGERQLSELLHTQVSIEKLGIQPFNELTLEGVTIPDQQGDSLFCIDRVGAGISLYNLVKHRRIVITYGEIIGLHGHITRPTAGAPTNMQFIIDAFKPKPNEPSKPYDVTIHNVVLRRSDVSYDVLDAPHVTAGRLDPNHLLLAGINADVALPRIKNDDYEIELRRLSFAERSGLVLKDLAFRAGVGSNAATLSDIRLELPHTILNVDDIDVAYNSLKTLGDELPSLPLKLSVANSYVTPSDLSPLLPTLSSFTEPLNVTMAVDGNADFLRVPVLSVNNSDNSLRLVANGNLSSLRDKEHLAFDIPHLSLTAGADEIAKITSSFTQLSPQASSIISKSGHVNIDGSLSGMSSRQLKFNGDVSTSLGDVDLNVAYVDRREKHIAGHIKTSRLQLGQMLSKQNLLGDVAMDADIDAQIVGGKLAKAIVKGQIDYMDFKGYRYHDVTADVDIADRNYSGHLTIHDPSGQVDVDGHALIDGSNTSIVGHFVADGIRPASLGLTSKYPNHSLTFEGDVSLTGNSLNTLDGYIDLNNVSFADGAGTGLHLGHVQLEADAHSPTKHIDLLSDYVDAHITGDYDVKTLVPTIKTMLARSFPQFFAASQSATTGSNHFDYSVNVRPVDEWQEFLKLPVRFVYDTKITGHVDDGAQTFDLHLDAPYLLQGKKIIEGTTLRAALEPENDNVTLAAHSLFPTKNGKIAINLDANGVNNNLDAHLNWKVMRDHDFHGDISLSTHLQRAADRTMQATVQVNQSELVFNDTTWHVHPATINIDHGVIAVNHLGASSDRQSINIAGVVSRDADDVLALDLNDVSLDYIFDMLNINNVDFGGRATGRFYASDLLSGAPRLWTPQLHVAGISYNNAVMGDADIESDWDNDEKAVNLHAAIKQRNGLTSAINGSIFIGADSLYLDFLPRRANIAFMQPFMSAFTSEVAGEVSGHAVLYGTFKDINLYGDVCADTLNFKLDFTNVYYTCRGDSVHMTPGLITFNDVTLHDREGHTATMNGWMRHENFHRPVFSFEVTDAHNLLCYDTDASINPNWYGVVYGNGAAFVSGSPGIVDIKVNMESSLGTKFTFVMSDAEEASEYHFITFRDRDHKDDVPQVVEEVDTIPEIVRLLTQTKVNQEQSQPTAFTIDLQGDISNNAQLVIVMDPVGGDQIKCTGSGNMRLTYNSNDELAMYGKYTLDKGSYNFTLQDIIIKEFAIRDGSSISFHGDPYAATLDLVAVYSLNANISDLDESFASDPEINRTNVPVHALLRANGIISQPDIAFDLEFPTLTTDAYRRIKSIISTDDMMNRQIIYLLAINRFYTPDYMNASTRSNNELTSVASSTISSQLSNILGKMSENWTIAPNFRSEKGDFSDMEVDLALSSQLLNNRLLLNGNFGYRDNTYNTRNSNFIGDFDIEYLLNPKGTFRLKAYNHFNDQNYYVRNALTTQGVGIVWKHDFDRPADLFRRRPKLSADSVAVPHVATDSVSASGNQK